MKTDYEKMGKEALERLAGTTADVRACQEAVLAEILDKNKDTVIGRKFGFSRIRTVEEYRKAVPEEAYEEYKPYIRRMLAGETNVLTRADAVHFCITSGSTDEPKYIPLTEEDIRIHYIYAYSAVFGMIREAYPDVPTEKLFPKIFQVGEFVKTWLPDGRMSGIRSSSLYQWLDRNGAFDASDYCVPKEVLFPEQVEDLTYVRARFALAEPEVRTIWGVFVHRIVGMMGYMEKNWQMLLEDMERGSVSPQAGISREWECFLKERLEPDPGRAAELRSLSGGSLREGMIRKIWKNTRSICAIGGSTFGDYMARLKVYAEGIPVHYFAYAATEGIFGIAPGMNRPDEYLLIPESGFFEFLPEGAKEGEYRTFGMGELRKGCRYELIFTNRSGLYRYRMRDILEVTGYYETCPVVKFCYRKNQVINVADEQTNLEQMEAAVKRYEAASGGKVGENYCLYADLKSEPPRYQVFLEEPDVRPKNADALFDRCMCAENLGYKGARRNGEAGQAHVTFLPRGSFAKYERYLEKSGRQMAQIKPLRMIVTEEGKELFRKAAEVAENEAE